MSYFYQNSGLIAIFEIVKNSIYLFFLSFPVVFFSQANDDCLNATTLCANQPINASNQGATINVCPGCEDGSTAMGDFCYELDNTVWFNFTTNNMGGDVEVHFSNLLCGSNMGFDNELQGVVIEATNACDASTYTSVSNCESRSSTDFTLSALGLAPNTTYYIQVDGDLDGSGITNAAECDFTIEVIGPGVEVSVDAGDDVTIFSGQSTALNGVAPVSAASVWSPSTSLSDTASPSAVATPLVTTTYYYTYASIDGCVYTDDVIVVVIEEITVMNTLTPNGDGINDFWEIKDIENFPAAKVSVFDRWGQRVFNTIGYTSDKRWDGNFLGGSLPSGTYYYTIDLNTGSGKDDFAGFVTVLK